MSRRHDASVQGPGVVWSARQRRYAPLLFIHPSAEYGRLLLVGLTALRVCLARDNFLVVFYSPTFLALGASLYRAGSPRRFVLLSIGLLGGVALLD